MTKASTTIKRQQNFNQTTVITIGVIWGSGIIDLAFSKVMISNLKRHLRCAGKLSSRTAVTLMQWSILVSFISNKTKRMMHWSRLKLLKRVILKI